MLEISKTAMDVFQRRAEEEFIDQATKQMAWSYDQLFKVAPRQMLREAIRAAYERAKIHGIKRAENITAFIDLAFSLGAQFDEDPQLPWAQQILGERGHVDEEIWIGRLVSRATVYRRAVQGENSSALLSAMQRLSQYQPSQAEHSVAAFASVAKQIYPEKASYVGAEGILALWQYGTSVLSALEADAPDLRNLILAAMFVFGAGCLTDPLLLAVCGQKSVSLVSLTATDFQAIIARGLRAWSI